MQEKDMETLWDKLKKAALERLVAEDNFKLARDALVSCLCTCYRQGEDWEERAIWCSERVAGSCPYYLELKKRNI